MRAPLAIAGSLTLAVICAAALFFVVGSGPDDAYSQGGPSAADVERFEERLAAMELRLEEVDRLEREVELLRDRASIASAKRVPAAADVSGAVAVKAVAEGVDAGEGAEGVEGENAIVGQRLAALLNVDNENIKDYIGQVYLDTRDNRKAREAEEAKQRQIEQAAMREGPFGKHNYRVNSIAKKLDLNDGQKQSYHELLMSYDEEHKTVGARMGELEKGASREQVKRYMQGLGQANKELNARLDADFSSLLSANQREIYDELPSHERRHGGGGGRAMWSVAKSFQGAIDFGEVRGIIHEIQTDDG